jgi:hypothetical protein
MSDQHINIAGVKVTDEGTWRHVRLVGPLDRGQDVLGRLSTLRARVKRSGPYTDKQLFPKVDTARFLILADIPLNSPSM